MSDISEFDQKWSIELQKVVCMLIVEQGLRALRNISDPEEDRGSLARDSEQMARDLSELPWQQIRYVIKRRL